MAEKIDRLDGFNSILVQLEASLDVKARREILSFNSILVQLEAVSNT